MFDDLAVYYVRSCGQHAARYTVSNRLRKSFPRVAWREVVLVTPHGYSSRSKQPGQFDADGGSIFLSVGDKKWDPLGSRLARSGLLHRAT